MAELVVSAARVVDACIPARAAADLTDVELQAAAAMAARTAE